MGARPRPPQSNQPSSADGTQVAFLRGMNLGKRRITNDQLQQLFADMGFDRVETFLASGNVLFRDKLRRPHLEDFIAEQLRTALGYEVPTLIRSQDELRLVATHVPFLPEQLAATSGKLQVILLPEVPKTIAAEQLLALASSDDQLQLQHRQLYWLPRAGLSDSELDTTAVQRAVDGAITIRTHRTIRRLVDKYLS